MRTERAAWPRDLLETARHAADPLADEVVQHIYERGEVAEVSRLLATIISNDSLPPDDLPTEVLGFLERTSRLPEWADPEQIARGEAVFSNHGPLCLAALIAASLNEGYALANLCYVLGATQKLEAHTSRRVLETAQLVVDVMAGGGLGPEGRGLRAAQRVRLLHGAIRHLIKTEYQGSNPGPPTSFADVLLHMEWPVRERGVPICQEDMAFTIVAFSYVVVRTLLRLDQQLSDADRDAYIHTWAVVGALMGVREDLLPRDFAGAEALFEAIYEHQSARSEPGILLTRRTVDAFYHLLRTRALPKFMVSRGLAVLIVRAVVDERTAETTELTKLSLLQKLISVPLLHLAVLILGGIDWFAQHDRALYLFQRVVSKHMVNHLVALPRGAGRGLFHLPDELRERWQDAR